MRSLCGELDPADFARVGVTGKRVRLESMTWCFLECSSQIGAQGLEFEEMK